jgi:hypothetical protein
VYAVHKPLFVVDRCKSCDGAVELECEGAPGYLGYRTHNEYFCPHCKKLNHVLTFGAIVSARAVTRSPARTD